MSEQTRKVLFLCTGNSARSILAEVLLNQLGKGRFKAYSAGSFPKGQIHPLAIELLDSLRLPTSGLRSKSWSEFAQSGAPTMDYVITVCDQAAGEVCPIWPGRPATAHWGLPDPAAAEGDHGQRLNAFRAAARIIQIRIECLLALGENDLGPDEFEKRLSEAGKLTAELTR